MISKELKTQIIHYCHRMDQKGWVANHDGNITYQLSDDSFAATPTARSKADLIPEDLIEVDKNGKKTVGQGSAFSEISVHLRVYASRPDVQAIVHAHPPCAMAVGCANQEMMTTAVPEAVVSLGPGIPLAGLSLPNSESFWNEMDTLVPYYQAIMVAGNGVFAFGSSLEQAFLRLELVEHLAKIFISSLPLGGSRMLECSQIAELLKKRDQAGLGLPPDPARPHWFGDFK